MSLSRLDLFFWAAGFLLNFVLLCILCYRRRLRTFPFFASTLALAVGRTIVLYLVRACCTPRDYFFTYWSLALVETLLQLGVVYELASKVFHPMNRWRSDLRTRFGPFSVLSVITALGISLLASPPAHSWIQAMATRANLFATALMSELFVAVMVMSLTAGLPWRSHAAAIAQGFGGYSLISLLLETGHAYFGVGRDVEAFVILSQLRMLSYLGCALYWIVNLNSEEQPGRIMTSQMHAALLTLHTQIAVDLRNMRLRKSK